MNKNIKIITEHWDKINPLKIEDYLRLGGYDSLKKYIFEEMDSSQAISEIKKSGLSGRGGAGFTTGEKMAMVASRKGKKYFICNLEESEPGTYKDRLIAQKNPHLLLEGVILASLVVGAQKAFIYINGNFGKQEDILKTALAQSYEKNFWGEYILKSNYHLEVEIFSGAGAYICGEETALINSLEGNRGEPKVRPPYPTERGFLGKPTCVNNAETVSNLPWIIKNGGQKYAKIGANCSPGTKLFVLGGAVKNPGVVEASTGTKISELIDEFGGGLSEGKEFWFAQIGGASGKLVLEDELETELTFSRDCPVPVGSGAILVVDKTADIYELLLSWAGFFRRESCGKCIPCREGTFRLYEIIERLRDGKISKRDKEALQDILWSLENTAFCPFGKFAATATKEALDKKLLVL